MREKRPEGFDEAESKAGSYINDKKKAQYLLDEALRKANNNKGALEKIWADLFGLFRLVGAWIKGEYVRVPYKTILYAIGAIIYFVNPFDVIPDFIPLAGYVDDATVIGFVINSIKDEIERFKKWEQFTP